jgi:hypothetical protein
LPDLNNCKIRKDSRIELSQRFPHIPLENPSNNFCISAMTVFVGDPSSSDFASDAVDEYKMAP